MLRLASYAAAALLLAALPANAREVEGRAFVIDGDTVDIAGARLRIAMVDAPEHGTLKGARSTVFLKSLAGPAPWRCQLERFEPPKPPYRARWISSCVVKSTGQDVGEAIIRAGYGFFARPFAHENPARAKTYRAAEEAARVGKLGLWGNAVTRPED